MAFGSVIKPIQPGGFMVQMEHFKDSQQLQNVLACSQECTALLKEGHASDVTPSICEYCPVHPRKRQDVFCVQCKVEVCGGCASTDHKNHQLAASNALIHGELRRVGEALSSVSDLLTDTKDEICGVKELRERVRNMKERNINSAQQVFASLRKAIDNREEEIISSIKEDAYKREKALELQLERLVLLWSQLKSCLELMQKTREEDKVKVDELMNRRKTLEQRRDHLLVMKRGSRLKPLRKEQREMKFEGAEQLHEEVHKLLGYVPLDPGKCEVVIPLMIVKKEAVLAITVRDINNDVVSDSSEELSVSVQVGSSGEVIVVKPVEDVSDGKYKATFTASRCGDHVISIVVDGQHIPGSPYRTSADRDYSKITSQEVVTHYGGKKFGELRDVTTGPNDEVIIVDGGNSCVVVLDCKFNLLKLVGQESGNSRLVNPYGVAVADSIIAVSDVGSDQVKKYSLDGELLSIIGSGGSKNGQFNSPRGLVFSANKMMYVVDRYNHKVQVFKDDTFAFSFGSRGSGPGQFQCSVRIATDPNTNILVSDYYGNCIHLFSHSGDFINKIDSYRPWAITVSCTGYIIADHDRNDNMITIWSPTHQLVHQFGQRGSQQGQFRGVTGVAIGSTGDIYVVESGNKRLQVISNH